MPETVSRSSPPAAPEAAWPEGMPYTVHFPQDDGFVGADLEHPAWLPRVGEVVEYIDEHGSCHRFRVKEVVHTLQSSAGGRPSVDEEPVSPNTLPSPSDDMPPELPGESGLVRAGLPKVVLERLPT